MKCACRSAGCRRCGARHTAKPRITRSKPSPRDAPVYDRGNRLDAPDFVFRTSQIVAVDHNEIGEFSRFERAARLLPELEPGRPNSPHLERFLPRNLFF